MQDKPCINNHIIMSSDSPVAELYSSDGYELSVQNNVTTPNGTRGIIFAGSDGTNTRFILVDGSSRQIVAGAGTAGTSVGGVLSVQGVSGGTAIPVSGTVTATNASVSTTGSAPPGSATYAGGSVTTLSPTYTTGQMNALSLTTAGALRVDGSAVTQPVSIASAVTVAQATAANLNATVTGTVAATQSGTWTNTVTQPTASSLNATIIGTASDNTTNSTSKIAVLSAVANTTAPTYTSGNMVPLSVDTSGNLRITGTISASNPSVTTTGSSPPTSATYIGGSVTTYPPSYTTGQMSGLSLTTGGLLRVASVIDPNLTIIHNNATITTSGSTVVTGIGRKEISFGITISGTVSGTTPTLTYLIEEIDPVNQSTVMTLPGNSITVGPYTSTGHTNYLQMISYTGAVKVVWTVTGTTPSFGGVDAWLLVKDQSNSFGLTFAGVSNPLSVVNIDSSNNTVVVGSGTAGTPAGGVLSIQGVSGGTSIPVTTTYTDTTATGSLGALNAAVQISTAGYNTAGFQLAAGTLIGTIIPEVSFDSGTTWTATYFDTPTSGKVSTIVFGSSNTATAATIVGVGGSGLSRVRVSAYTSGTANITVRSTTRTDPSVLFAGPIAVAGPPSTAQVGGAVTTASPTYTTGTLNNLSLNTSGGLRVDGSAVTQPVSIASAVTVAQATASNLNATVTGTVTSNQGTANTLANAWSTKITDATNGPVAVKAASTAAVATDPSLVIGFSPNSPLPTGSNTIGALTANQSVNLNQVGGAAVVTGGVAGTQGVGGLAASGSVPSGNPVLVAGSDGTDVRTLSTDSTGRLSTKAICSTGTNTTVASATSSTTLLAVNTNRIGATIYNASTAILYVKFSATASTSSYTLQIAANGYFEVPYGYTGVINGIWASANGNAQITELT